MGTPRGIFASSKVSTKTGEVQDADPIHRVMALRNAFAHHPTDAHPVLVVGKTEQNDSSHFELHVLSGSGRISRIPREQALDEFNAAYQKAKASLVALRDAVKAT
jgi:hypothetical protein